VDLAEPRVIFGEVGAEQITFVIFTATADHDAIWWPIRFRDKVARGLFRCEPNPTTGLRITRAEATNKRAMFEGHSLRDGSIKHRRKGFTSAHETGSASPRYGGRCQRR
jgi:hypothetical protein